MPTWITPTTPWNAMYQLGPCMGTTRISSSAEAGTRRKPPQKRNHYQPEHPSPPAHDAKPHKPDENQECSQESDFAGRCLTERGMQDSGVDKRGIREDCKQSQHSCREKSEDQALAAVDCHLSPVRRGSVVLRVAIRLEDASNLDGLHQRIRNFELKSTRIAMVGRNIFWFGTVRPRFKSRAPDQTPPV